MFVKESEFQAQTIMNRISSLVHSKTMQDVRQFFTVQYCLKPWGMCRVSQPLPVKCQLPPNTATSPNNSTHLQRTPKGRYNHPWEPLSWKLPEHFLRDQQGETWHNKWERPGCAPQLWSYARSSLACLPLGHWEIDQTGIKGGNWYSPCIQHGGVIWWAVSPPAFIWWKCKQCHTRSQIKKGSQSILRNSGDKTANKNKAFPFQITLYESCWKSRKHPD